MPASVLDSILAAAGVSADEADGVAIRGADPVLPIALPVGEAAAAAIAAGGVAASAVWRRRTRRRQGVAVDVRRAAAAMRSNVYMRLDGDTAALREPPDATGIYRARDGRWVYLHCHFAHHQARVLGVLGCDADRGPDRGSDRDDVERAVAGWDAEALQEAVVAAGACSGVVRSADEWHAHPQGRAVDALPLLEVTRFADSPPEPFHPLPDSDDAGPLTGVRVLDLTRVLAGPTAARTLAEHGAHVLRIGTPHLANPLAQILDTGHGKRSALLDLQTDDGAAKLRSLARDTDVFSQGYRPGSFGARGLSPERLHELRPGIVYVTLSAFGHEGPWSGRRGFDTLVQCCSGIAAEHGGSEQPRLLPVSALDYLTGYLAAFGTMAALARRADEGGSYLVRVSLAQTARWLTSLDRLPADRVAAVPADLPADEIASYMTESRTPVGVLRHLAPAVEMSETPARWRRPAVPIDNDQARW